MKDMIVLCALDGWVLLCGGMAAAVLLARFFGCGMRPSKAPFAVGFSVILCANTAADILLRDAETAWVVTEILLMCCTMALPYLLFRPRKKMTFFWFGLTLCSVADYLEYVIVSFSHGMTRSGERTYTCSVCSDSYTEEIPATGHTTEHKTDPATCTEAGAEYDLCTVCGTKLNETVIPATGHKYDVVVTKDATCTETGVYTYTCSVCGDSYTEPIPPTGHSLAHQSEPPTCTEDGAEYDLCTVCGRYFNVKMFPAAGHRFVDGVCTVCGATHYWEYTIQNGGAQITAYNGDAAWLKIPSVIDGYLVTSIGPAAFSGNADMEYVCVPDSVTSIGAYAFADCTALKEINVGAHVARIDAGAFSHCPSLAIVCFFSGNLALRSGMFSDADARMSIIAPSDSKTEQSAIDDGLHCVGYTYPQEKDGKRVLAFGAETTLYADLDYGYWTEFAARYADIYYLYFEELTFDGISPSLLKGEDAESLAVDMNADNLTMREIYISVDVNGEHVTFQRLVDLLQDGQLHLAVTFENSSGKKLTIFQKIGIFVNKVFNALTKLLRSIVRIFKH